jgi:hypothetical protein
VEWPYPFSPIEFPDAKLAFETELLRELKPGHPLFGIPISAIGRRYDQDDVLFELLDGSGRVAEVHLTWARERETPPWPDSSSFENFDDWVESVREKYPPPSS